MDRNHRLACVGITGWNESESPAGLRRNTHARQRDRPPDVIIPPRASAVLSNSDGWKQTARDCHTQLMAGLGRIGWQAATGYGRRNHAETAMSRYKHLIGPKLRARSLPGQQAEAAIAVVVLNRMIRTAKPVTIRR